MRVLSFGAGVQSTALLIACARGLLEPIDAAIFADTGAEPKKIYDWLEFIEGQFPSVKFIKVKKGEIDKDTLGEGCFASAPFYMRNLDGKGGMLKRQCTSDYKIKPIHDYLRPFKEKGRPITVLMGISTDEAQRAKESRVKWIKNEFPLLWIDLNAYCGGTLGWSRQKCIEYVKAQIGREPPKSACYFCPYTDDTRWIEMKENDPDTFKRAVEFDKAIRIHRRAILKTEMYVHKSMVPLDQVKFTPKTDPAQMSMLDECDGMCGL